MDFFVTPDDRKRINSILKSYHNFEYISENDTREILYTLTGIRYKNINYLGSGSTGSAFLFDKKYVIKFTISYTELKECSYLLKKNLKHFSKIYYIYKRRMDENLVRGFVIREYIKNEIDNNTHKLLTSFLNNELLINATEKDINNCISFLKEVKRLNVEVDDTRENFGTKNGRIVIFDPF